MTELLTAAQMRAIEQAAIESGGVTGLELMERAGLGVVAAIFEEWPELAKSSGRAVVLCGPGNNGGDGFVVARLLKEWGWAVEVFLYGDPEKLPPDARVNYERWLESGSVSPLPEGFWLPRCDLHVDALFGTGLKRSISSKISYSLSYLNKSHPHFVSVAVDIVSGICADSGRPIGVSGNADLTVTFHRAKVGHYLGQGSERSGRIVVKDIGLPGSSFAAVADLFAYLNDPAINHISAEEIKDTREEADRNIKAITTLAKSSNVNIKKSNGQKFSHGHALILSGGAGKTGAARLAARGALRIGSGLVTLGVPPSAQMEVASQVTAIMLQRVEGADGFSDVLQDARLNALCLGPGLGVDRARELVPVALAAERATVLDADALTAYADDPSDLFAKLHENCVLTPHGGEFARLFPDVAEKLGAVPTKGPAYSKVDATREAAKRAGCVVLFKGPDTVIAAPNGQCSINAALYERAAPWLATAGSGDVLAGFITGLLARGFGAMQAAKTAAWLHVECARAFGPGLIAEDLPEQLPNVFKELNI
ncbi:NAD(P)H-hydrate dehydratase [Ruegeria sp.]|uniref:NAD(P)H-hydrate dehydratase n=1 Tax=Ruegeria sp. TaxID=1879320 RepID=UPI003B5AD1C1